MEDAPDTHNGLHTAILLQMGGRRNVTVMASVAFPGMKEQYETLRLSPGASEKDVKRAYRGLALQVCKYPFEAMSLTVKIIYFQ